MKNRGLIRIIPKLEIKNGMLIKGINMEGLRVLGNPFNFANYYYNNSADEICYVDNVATLYGTNNLSNFISRTAKNIFIPISVGGGIRKISDIERVFKSGADKVCVNSAVVDNINFLREASRVFGSANITVMIEYIKIKNKYFITKSSGRDIAQKNPFDWAKEVEQNGAGEIFLTSVNHEGLKRGYDIETIRKISKSVSVPVIAHGGAGSLKDIYDVIKKTHISGVSLSSILHYGIAKSFKNKNFEIGNLNYLENIKYTKKKPQNFLKSIKLFLKKKGIHVRI